MNDKVTPCFYFPGNADEAVEFYVSLLSNSRVIEKTHYPSGGPQPEGSLMTVQFELQGREFMAINGGPEFEFSPAISMVAYCDTQEEIDRLWDAFLDGGEPLACGWLTDRFGVSWQVVPSQLPVWMTGDSEAGQRVVQALWTMIKLDMRKLQEVAEG